MICRTCQEPLRFGHRRGTPGWWHREDKDHDGFPVVEPENAPPPEIPAPEVPVRDYDPADLPPRSGIRQIVNLVGKTDGWDLRALRYCKGPYVGSKGVVLSISEALVVKARGQTGLDGRVPVAVGFWRDLKFDFAYVGYVVNGVLAPVRTNSAGLKSFIKTGEIIAVAADTEEDS